MAADNVKDNPRAWGAGHHYTHYDMDELEIRKVRAFERIADALDGQKTSKWSGNVSGSSEAKNVSRAQSSKGVSSLFDVFRT